MVAAFILIASLGVYLLNYSHAATFATSAEAESGTIVGNATNVTDSNASGGRAIQFGTSTSSGQMCTDPIFTSSAQQGRWPSTGSTYVNNNVWNTQEAGPQTIYVCGYNSFYVVANQPNLANDQGSVKSYPSTCNCGFNQAMSTFHGINSTFGDSAPYMGEWNAAYDIFMSSGQEIMIDNDQNNHGTGIQQGGTPATIDGVNYHVIHSGTIYFLRDSNVQSGSINFLDFYNWIVAQGWDTMSDKLNLFGYGIEISYTDSSPGVAGQERFDITDFSVTAN